MTNETEQGRESKGIFTRNQFLAISTVLDIALLFCGIRIGRDQETRAYERQISEARIEDVNQDGRYDLRIGNELYIQTDNRFVPANEYFGRER